MRRAGWVVLGWLVLLSFARADEADEIPIVGRPAYLPFSDASAKFIAGPEGEYRVPFRLTTTATPTRIKGRTPITYVVQLQALGPIIQPPARIDLRQVGEFDRHFHIEDNTDSKRERIDPRTWRYEYSLTPRSADVDEVPGFPFVFYNPELRPIEKAFQVLYSDPISLLQEPARTTTGPIGIDESLLTLAPEDAVLDPSRPWSGPGPIAWISAIIGCPLAGMLWYLVWRRLYPDAARRAAQRRSRAARVALARVGQAQHAEPRQQAEQLTQALVGYLHERFDLRLTEPTPDEVSMHLTRHGFSEPRTRQASALLADCAQARFGPTTEGPGLVEQARQLILDLEEDTCPA